MDAQTLQKNLDEKRRRVDVDNFDISVGELVRMATKGELTISPEYQRKFRWDQKRESELIESVFLGLPIPGLYVAANPEGTWDLVDGVQRVSTLIHFSADHKFLSLIGKTTPLILSDLDELKDFNALTYSQIPSTIRLLHFDKRFIRVTALSDKSDTDVRYELFERLNTGGVVLSQQEIRSCVYRGKPTEFINRCADVAEFKNLLKLQKLHQEDGTKEEVALKFFAYLYSREKFDGKVTKFLSNYLKENRGKFETEKNFNLFSDASKKLWELTGRRAFLRPKTPVTPLVELEACLVSIGEALLRNYTIGHVEPDVWIEDEELVRNSSGGSNTKRMLVARVSRAFKLFTGVDLPEASGETQATASA